VAVDYDASATVSGPAQGSCTASEFDPQRSLAALDRDGEDAPKWSLSCVSQVKRGSGTPGCYDPAGWLRFQIASSELAHHPRTVQPPLPGSFGQVTSMLMESPIKLGTWLNQLFVSAQPATVGERLGAPASLLIRLMFAVCLLMTGSFVANGETLGHCRFDPDTLSFSGTPREQAQCLLRSDGKFGHVGANPAMLPRNLDGLIGNQVQISRDAVRGVIRSLGFSEAAVGGSLDQGLSHGRGGSAAAPQARYFVIHDTSSPFFGNREFPSDINTSQTVNDLKQFAVQDPVAHMFINRRGDMLVGHQLSVPWRATKLERQIGIPSKGMFIHVESIQPRRSDPSGGPKNDAVAPDPGFTREQYDRLALLYVIASSRAGVWMIPAFHAAIDEDISDAHDDPQNFDLVNFDTSLGQLLMGMD